MNNVFDDWLAEPEIRWATRLRTAIATYKATTYDIRMVGGGPGGYFDIGTDYDITDVIDEIMSARMV